MSSRSRSQKTAAAALVGLLCDLRKQAKGEGDRRYYYYKAVVALLNHKFVKGYCAKEIDELTERIHRENVVYVDEEQLRFHPLAEWIFAKTELPEYLLNTERTSATVRVGLSVSVSTNTAIP